MTSFVVLSAILALVAIFIVAYPLLRPLPTAAKGEPVAPKAAPLAFALSVVLALAAVFVYSQVTNFPWDNPIAAQAVPPGHGQMGAGGSMQEVTASLEARLQQDPNDREGWRMLGRTYLMAGDAAKAAAAYERATVLSPAKDPALELDLAEALVLSEDPNAQPRAKAIIDEALAADAGNQKALWYRGVMGVRSGDNEIAKVSWSKLLEANPPPEIREVIASQLKELGVDVPDAPGSAMGATGPAMGSAGAMASMGGSGGTVTPAGRTIRVSVSVDPALAGKLQPGVPLFVSAREPGIPGPPIAAVRVSTDQLPTTVVLSDANSMIEGRTLSSVSDIEVTARVAFGGTVATASGDLVGSALQKKGGAENLEVVIAKVQP